MLENGMQKPFDMWNLINSPHILAVIIVSIVYPTYPELYIIYKKNLKYKPIINCGRLKRVPKNIAKIYEKHLKIEAIKLISYWLMN